MNSQTEYPMFIDMYPYFTSPMMVEEEYDTPHLDDIPIPQFRQDENIYFLDSVISNLENAFNDVEEEEEEEEEQGQGEDNLFSRFEEIQVPLYTPVEFEQQTEAIDKCFNIIVRQDLREEEERVEDCAICLESKTYNSCCFTNCRHMFCVDCMSSFVKSCVNKNNTPCPLCRTEITGFEFVDIDCAINFSNLI